MASSETIPRRGVLAGSVGLAAGTAAMSTAAAATPKTNFLLVHGSWHGGWCWRRVSDALTARGHRVFTPTLTGLGERSHLMSADIVLDTHITDIVNVAKFEDLQGFVLCGHSYGGMVITGVAEQIGDRIGSIVYLDAYIPKDGQSMGEISRLHHAPGMSTPAPSAAAFKVNAADQAWVNSHLTPQPNGVYAKKLRVSGAYERIARRAYARTTIYNSPVFRANFERLRATPGWRTYEIESGHDAMVDRPDDVVRIMEASI